MIPHRAIRAMATVLYTAAPMPPSRPYSRNWTILLRGWNWVDSLLDNLRYLRCLRKDPLTLVGNSVMVRCQVYYKPVCLISLLHRQHLLTWTTYSHGYIQIHIWQYVPELVQPLRSSMDFPGPSRDTKLVYIRSSSDGCMGNSPYVGYVIISSLY